MLITGYKHHILQLQTNQRTSHQQNRKTDHHAGFFPTILWHLQGIEHMIICIGSFEIMICIWSLYHSPFPSLTDVQALFSFFIFLEHLGNMDKKALSLIFGHPWASWNDWPCDRASCLPSFDTQPWPSLCRPVRYTWIKSKGMLSVHHVLLFLVLSPSDVLSTSSENWKVTEDMVSACTNVYVTNLKISPSWSKPSSQGPLDHILNDGIDKRNTNQALALQSVCYARFLDHNVRKQFTRDFPVS